MLVFNVRRNDYRLIVAMHFNRQIVYTLRFMTHAEYSKVQWKDVLSKPDFERLPKDYVELCRIHLPRPISDKVDYENVVRITDVMAGRKLTADQEDYFDLLCRLIEDYQESHLHVSLTRVGGIEALQHLMEAHDMNAADLSRLLDVHRTLGAMILRGERQMTLNHVRILAKHFGVSADLFLG